MDLDAAWFEGDSAIDVYETMRAQEDGMPQFSKESSFISRRDTVHWMINVAEGFRSESEKFSFDNRTIHLAVYLFDYYIQRHNPPLGSILRAAAAALIVAAKFEEEGQFATIATRAILSMMQSMATTVEIRLQEQAILAEVGFQLLVPFSVTYVPYFIAFSDGPGSIGRLCDHKDCDRKSFTGHHSTAGYLYLPEAYFTDGECQKHQFLKCEYFESLVYYFCRIALKGISYWQFKPSKIAASALSAARFCIGAAPTWPSSMASLTKYTIGDLNVCIGLMLHDFDFERLRTPTLFPQITRSRLAIGWVKCSTSVFTPGASNCASVHPDDSSGASTPVPIPLRAQTAPATVLNGSGDEAKPVLFLLLNTETDGVKPVVLVPRYKSTSGLGILAAAASMVDEHSGNGRAKRMKLRE